MKFKEVRKKLALALCAAMALTMIPTSAFTSLAALSGKGWEATVTVDKTTLTIDVEKEGTVTVTVDKVTTTSNAASAPDASEVAKDIAEEDFGFSPTGIAEITKLEHTSNGVKVTIKGVKAGETVLSVGDKECTIEVTNNVLSSTGESEITGPVEVGEKAKSLTGKVEKEIVGFYESESAAAAVVATIPAGTTFATTDGKTVVPKDAEVKLTLTDVEVPSVSASGSESSPTLEFEIGIYDKTGETEYAVKSVTPVKVDVPLPPEVNKYQSVKWLHKKGSVWGTSDLAMGGSANNYSLIIGDDYTQLKTYSLSPFKLRGTNYAWGKEGTVSAGVGTNSYTSRRGTTATKATTYSGEWVKAKDGVRWWYQFSDGTYPADRWVEINYHGVNQWYFFDAEGYMATGWLKWIDGNWYYLHPYADGDQGYMYTGWHEINGKSYYFNETSDGTKGRMYANYTFGDGRRVDESGALVQ